MDAIDETDDELQYSTTKYTEDSLVELFQEWIKFFASPDDRMRIIKTFREMVQKRNQYRDKNGATITSDKLKREIDAAYYQAHGELAFPKTYDDFMPFLVDLRNKYNILGLIVTKDDLIADLHAIRDAFFEKYPGVFPEIRKRDFMYGLFRNVITNFDGDLVGDAVGEIAKEDKWKRRDFVDHMVFSSEAKNYKMMIKIFDNAMTYEQPLWGQDAKTVLSLANRYLENDTGEDPEITAKMKKISETAKDIMDKWEKGQRRGF